MGAGKNIEPAEGFRFDIYFECDQYTGLNKRTMASDYNTISSILYKSCTQFLSVSSGVQFRRKLARSGQRTRFVIFTIVVFDVLNRFFPPLVLMIYTFTFAILYMIGTNDTEWRRYERVE